MLNLSMDLYSQYWNDMPGYWLVKSTALHDDVTFFAE